MCFVPLLLVIILAAVMAKACAQRCTSFLHDIFTDLEI
jgi:hypothetical protein